MELSNSRYEDIEAVGRIGNAETQLVDVFSSYHKEVMENFNLLSGQLFSEADLKKLAKEKRPHFMVNLLHPIILQIAGNFKNSMPGLEFRGRTRDDELNVKMFENLNTYIMYQANDIYYDLAKAFVYAVVGRIGWLKTDYMFTRKHPQGMIDISVYDPFRLKFDTEWNTRDTEKCKFMSDGGWYSVEEVINIYGRKNSDLALEIEDKSKDIFGESSSRKFRNRLATWAERILNLIEPSKASGYDSNSMTLDRLHEWHNQAGRLKVVDFYEKRMEPVMSLYDRLTGEQYDITEHVKDEQGLNRGWYDSEKLMRLQEQFTDPYIDEDQVEYTYQTSVAPALMLKLYEGKTPIQNGFFKYTPIFCYDFHPDVLKTKSVVDAIKDPVKSYNLRENTILTFLMRQAHGGWIAEKSALKENEARFRQNKIGDVKIVEDNALTRGKVREIQQPTYPTGLERYAEGNKIDVKEVSGVQANSMGKEQSDDESGYLFNQRVEQQNIMQEWINENAQNAMKLLAEQNIDYSQKYLTEERVLRIDHDYKKPSWLVLNQRVAGEILNDVTFGKFDVVISKTPFGKASKEKEVMKLDQIFQRLQGLGPQYTPALAQILMEMIKLNDVSSMDKVMSLIEQATGITQEQLSDDLAMKQMSKQSQTHELKGKELSNQSAALNNKKTANEINMNDILSQMPTER